MTPQDIAVLATTQLAILVAAALAVHTAWVAGYDRGWADRQRLDPFWRFGQAVKRAVRGVAATLGRFNEAITASGQRMADDAEEYANAGEDA